jgi:DNA-binding IclR family transcriptional regulator
MERIAENPEEPVPLSELAKMLDISSPACSNIIRTMVKLGYLEPAAAKRGYAMGITPYLLTRKGPFRKDLTEVARPVLEKMASKINEMTVLVTESMGQRVELLKFEGDRILQVREPNPQSEKGLFGFSTGTLMLSYKDEKNFRSYWENYTHSPNMFNAESVDDALKTAAAIKEKGFFTNGVEDLGKTASVDSVKIYAFPIFDTKSCCASIGVTAPAIRLTAKHDNIIISEGLSNAKIISEKLQKRI